MRVSLVSMTMPMNTTDLASPEDAIVYCARVSNPLNQSNIETAPKLIGFLIKQKHWSPFEMIDFTVEIYTSRAIAAQILRHKSFSFQEWSQRYSEAPEVFEPQEIRYKGSSNRQGSVPAAPDDESQTHDKFLRSVVAKTQAYCAGQYRSLLDQGVAPEVARMVLPLGVQTRLYMKGSVRSWIHYLEARCDSHAQKEHQEVALAIREIFIKHFPHTSAALGWTGTDAL